METVSVEDAIRHTSATLRSAGIEGATNEARLLVAHTLECDSASLHAGAGNLLSVDQRRRLDGLVLHRARRAPLAQVTGIREFWSRDFEVTVDTLTPRPDSETLIQCCLDRFGSRGPASILDLGTGSGCLLVTLLAIWKRSQGLGVDLSEHALAVAARNARRHGVGERAAFICGDWDAAVAGRFDLVVSNPPYVRTGEIGALDPEVALHEPGIAIDGGPDGLDCYRRIVPGLARHLSPGGVVVLEHGPNQGSHIVSLASPCGLGMVVSARDLAGRRRVLVFGAEGRINCSWNAARSWLPSP